MPSTLLTLAIAAASFVPAQPYYYFESPRAYEIAVRVAVASLPDELRPAFEALRPAIVEASTNKLADAGDEIIHLFPLDGGAEDADPKQRRAYVQRILLLVEKTKTNDVHRRVTWDNTLHARLTTACRSLGDSFKSKDKDDITRDAGAVLHFALDSAMPFNATHEKWCESVRAAPDDKQNVTSQPPRYRYHVVLVNRLAERFIYEARVAPQRVHTLKDISRSVFDTLAAAHESALDLEQIERNLLAEARFSDSSNAADKDAAFQEALAERAAPILETRIEAGALLGAELIVSAWIEAGRPALPAGATGPAPGAASAGSSATSAPPKTTAAFVASRNSTTFHRVSCSHAERIKPENRAYFDTIEQARAQGRTPCKTCKPDQP